MQLNLLWFHNYLSANGVNLQHRVLVDEEFSHALYQNINNGYKGTIRVDSETIPLKIAEIICINFDIPLPDRVSEK